MRETMRLREAIAGELEGTLMQDETPNQWADHSKNRMQFDYDAYAEVEKWWMGDERELIEIIAGEGGDDASQDSSQDDGEERIVNQSHGTSFQSSFPLSLYINLWTNNPPCATIDKLVYCIVPGQVANYS